MAGHSTRPTLACIELVEMLGAGLSLFTFHAPCSLVDFLNWLSAMREALRVYRPDFAADADQISQRDPPRAPDGQVLAEINPVAETAVSRQGSNWFRTRAFTGKLIDRRDRTTVACLRAA